MFSAEEIVILINEIKEYQNRFDTLMKQLKTLSTHRMYFKDFGFRNFENTRPYNELIEKCDELNKLDIDIDNEESISKADNLALDIAQIRAVLLIRTFCIGTGYNSFNISINKLIDDLEEVFTQLHYREIKLNIIKEVLGLEQE